MWIRRLLASLLIFGAVNAFAVGYYGLSGAEGVPLDWLAGSPFTNYFLPSLILFVVVGGVMAISAVMVFAAHQRAQAGAFAAGAVLLVWIIVQVEMIGYVSWMQPATCVAALLIVVMASLLPCPNASTAGFDVIVANLVTVATSVAFGAAIFTLPKSGPFCTVGCVPYPFTAAASYVPSDFLWMYPALLPAPLFVMLLCGLYARAAMEKKIFAQVAIALGTMAATILTAVYFIQLRYVQPALVRGEFDGLTAWSQFNPHGVFIALEESGYVLMATAFLFAGLTLPAASRVLRAVRILFVLGFSLMAIAFFAFSIRYGVNVEYRFEVAVIAIDWTVLIVAGALLAVGTPDPEAFV